MMLDHLRKSLKPLVATGAIIALAVMMAGCLASTPSGTEFQKETKPSSSSKTTTSQAVTSPLPGKIAGYEIYENKDPFQPLIGAGAATRTITTTTTDASGAVVSSSTASVRLESITADTASISVNGTSHAGLKAGDTFASSFKLISIGTGSVIVQYGDNQYTLYLGETINVK